MLENRALEMCRSLNKLTIFVWLCEVVVDVEQAEQRRVFVERGEAWTALSNLRPQLFGYTSPTSNLNLEILSSTSHLQPWRQLIPKQPSG
jgi:hypothetical protein